MLAAGLLFGGGAVAVADDTGASSGPGQGSTSNQATTDQQSTNQGPADSTGSTTPATKVGTEDADGEGDGAGTTTTTVRNDTTDDESGLVSEPADDTDTVVEDEEAGPSAAKTTPADSTGTTEPSASETAETTAPAASTTPSGSGAEPTSEAPVVPSPFLGAPTTAPNPAVDPVWKALEPVSNAVNTLGRMVISVPGRLVEISTSPTPVRDVIAEVQEMLTTVYGAVTPLIEVPGNLYALLGVPATPAPPLIGTGGSLDGFPVEIPEEAPLFGPQPAQVAPTYVPAPAPLFGNLTPRPTLGKVATAPRMQPLTVSGIVPLKMDTPRTAQSLFQHVIEAVLVPASLTALAAVALPGLGALLVVSAAGIRLGYRQAKAALKMRASGIARFAGPGPIGVVRSGSMIALRQRARGPRTTRAVCPEAAAQSVPAETTDATVNTLERIA
ncbi:hypothetical protein [Mycolicibacterium phlei]